MNIAKVLIIFVIVCIIIWTIKLDYLNTKITKITKLTKSEKDILIRQAARWSIAAEQDINPIISLLHANYGTAYCIFMVMNGIESNKFYKNIIDIDRRVIKKISKKCNQDIEINKNINDLYFFLKNNDNKNNDNKNQDKSTDPINIALDLIEGIQEYSRNKSLLNQLICANYCCGVLWALLDVRTTDQINTIAGDILVIRNNLVNWQDTTTKELSKQCEYFTIRDIGDKYLARIAGDI